MIPRRFVPLARAALLAAACTSNPRTPHGPIAPTLAPTPASQHAIDPDGPTISPSPARNLAAQPGACGTGHIGALAMVPASATMVIGVDVPGLVRSPFYVAHRGELEIGGFKRVLELAAACDLGISSWRTLTVASDTTANATTMVIQADGLGDRRRLECVRERAAALDTQAPAAFTIAEVEGRTELTLADGGHGWVVDSCTVVLADAKVVEATRARLGGSGTALLDGPIMPALGRVGTGHPLWLAVAPLGVLNPSTVNARDIVLALDIDRGFRLDASLAFTDPASAQTASTNLEREVASLKPMLTSLGLPQSVADSIGVTAAGTLVSIRAHGDEAALDGLRERITMMLAGMN